MTYLFCIILKVFKIIHISIQFESLIKVLIQHQPKTLYFLQKSLTNKEEQVSFFEPLNQI